MSQFGRSVNSKKERHTLSTVKQPETMQRSRVASTGMPLITVKNLVKTFDTPAGSFKALRGISLQIKQGEFVAVVGKSGSGKSTLLNMLTGIAHPTSGEVIIGDITLHQLSESQTARWRGRNVGIVFQFFQLLPTLTVVENVMLAMDFCKIVPVSQRRSRALELLGQMGIAEQAHKLPSTLSGGQQQRVAIARALANDPPLIVADEPTGNLDTQTASTVFQMLEAQVSAGKTVIVVTHERDFAAQVDHTITLVDGLIVAGTA